jgi:hypothetical protein
MNRVDRNMVSVRTGRVAGGRTATRTPWLAVCVATGMLAVLALGASAEQDPIVGAGGAKTLFLVDGEIGTSLLDNGIEIYRAPGTPITVSMAGDNQLVVQSGGSGSGDDRRWSARISTPEDRPIETGDWSSGGTSGNHGLTPWLRLSGAPWACQSETGQFTIHELDTADLVVSRLALSFEHHCEGAFEAIYGEVRYASDLPVSAITIDQRQLGFDGASVGVPAPDRTVTVTNIGDVDQVLHARLAGLDRDEFGIISDACSTSPLAPGAACAITVRFTPTRMVPASATLELTDSTPRGEHHVVLAGSPQ